MAQRKVPVLNPEMEIDDNPLKWGWRWWVYDPVPPDWWAHLKVEQQELVMHQQLKVLQVKLRAEMDVKKAQLEAVTEIGKAVGMK